MVELHGTILQLRMVPVAQVFRSFPRLVRDVSRQLDKNVALVTRGETTEADKTMVDRLFEPLVHLVRNALDHGIESPEQRRAAGKPETATISIEASRIGDRFLVEVTDDGRGIDPAIVRRKASERRLVPADELAALTDEQVVDLVFLGRIFDRCRSLGYFRPRLRNGRGPHGDRADRRQGFAGEPSRNRHHGAARPADEHRDVPHHGGRGRRTVVRHCHGRGVRDGACHARPDQPDQEQ